MQWLLERLKDQRERFNAWLPEQSDSHLRAIRLHELELLASFIPDGSRVLEIGASSGQMSLALQNRGFSVTAIDVVDSEESVFPVSQYDGRSIPYPDRSFDVVLTSHVLEHIPHIVDYQREIHRVLRPSGVAIHAMPSASWRLWTILTEAIRRWRPAEVHGEHSAHLLSEAFRFTRWWWISHFRKTGWHVERHTTNRLFYTGNSIVDSRAPIPMRARLSRVFGSSGNVFVVRSALEVTHSGTTTCEEPLNGA